MLFRSPPDKITTSILQHLMIKLIVYRFASFTNVNCHQLIVELFPKPASFKIIVESEFSLENQINPEPPRFYAFEMTPTDPSKTTTAIATISPVNQTMDSATSTMMIEPNAPFLKPTVDPSISCGESIFEPWTYFASARQILFNKIKSSANQSHGNRRSNMISNLATSVIGQTPDTPSQVCEGESVNQIPIGARETETVELEREQKAQSASNPISSHLLFRARSKPLRCSLRNANILASEGESSTSSIQTMSIRTPIPR